MYFVRNSESDLKIFFVQDIEFGSIRGLTHGIWRSGLYVANLHMAIAFWGLTSAKVSAICYHLPLLRRLLFHLQTPPQSCQKNS